eukprot:10120482-Lingulodinium_polyedra.AAC.1
MAQILEGPDAFEQMAVGKEMRAFVRTTMDQTWFTMAGSEANVATQRGTKAGDPLGDLLFAVAARRVFFEINEELADAGLALDLPYCNTS